MLPTLLLAASPSLAAAAQPPACTAGFTHPQKDESLHFVYTQNTPNTFGPSAIDVPVTAVRCSPAGRIIIVTEGEDAPATCQPTAQSVSQSSTPPHIGSFSTISNT